MSEYVTKEQVKEEIISWARCINNPERLVTEDALYVIDALPAADVRPVWRGSSEIEMSEMTLNEAIEHAKEVAKTSCGDCAKEHVQLAGWLEELVAFKRVAPTPADVRPVVKGRWIGDGDCIICSNCKTAYTFMGSNFCPNCGADMEDKEPVDKFEGWSDELKQAYKEMLEKLDLLGGDADGDKH